MPFFNLGNPYFVELELPRFLSGCSGYLQMMLITLSRVRSVDERKSL
jgi:hypothetical protein